MNLFDLYARIVIDPSEFEEGLSSAQSKASAFADKLKSGLATAGKVAAAGLTAASAATVALAKSAVEGYAEYEQLVGGVDTLFKESSNRLQEYAANAYQTAGMSANEYMSTITSFSAALINSVGGDTERAADMADRALTDMADNANKMGTSIDSIVQTYQSLSRGNFAMLDNLKLGYGGTKAELERLLEDAEAYKASMGEIVDYDASSFADIVSGIGAIQEKMGIAGATAAEAATTIQGSVASMKAAWSNLVVGFADGNQDLGVLIDNFMESVVTVGENVIPRIIETVPRIFEAFHIVITKGFPRIIEAGKNMLVSLASGLENAIPNMISRVPVIIEGLAAAISKGIPQLLDAGKNILDGLTSGIEGGIPGMLSKIPVILKSFLDYITNNLPVVLQKGKELLNSLISGIVETIPALLGILPEIISAIKTFIKNNVPVIVQTGKDILQALITGIVQTVNELVAALPQIIDAFVSYVVEVLPTILNAGAEMLMSLIDGILGAIPSLVAALPKVISTILGAIAEALPLIIQTGFDLLFKLADGMFQALPELLASLPEIGMAILDGIAAALGGIVDIGASIVSGLWEGIVSMGEWLAEKISGFFTDIVDGAKETLGINSPSKVFAGIGGNMALGLEEGWGSEHERIKSEIENGMSFEMAQSNAAAYGYEGMGRTGATQDIVINLTDTIDGSVLARRTYRYNQREGTLRGASLVEVNA